MRVALVIGATLIVLAAIGHSGSGSHGSAVASSTPAAVDTAVSAELVADYLDATKPNTIPALCLAAEMVGDRDIALASFAEGYTTSSPSAEDVFNEIMSRC